MMDLRQFPQNPKALLIEAKDKIIALEAQLAEANKKLDKYAGMCLPCPDMGMTLVVEQLEQEIAEANEKARRIQAVDKDWKWRGIITKLQEYAYHYGDDALAEQLDELEIELICQEARIKFDGEVIDDEREAARLQRALDRIEMAGHDEWVLGKYRSYQNTTEYECSLIDEDAFTRGTTAAEAAEQAAAVWAEQQVAAHE
jgi:hypothetical protein